MCVCVCVCVCWAHRQSHLRGVVNTKYSSTIHPAASAAHPASGSAGGLPVVAHTHQQPKQPCGRGEGSSASAAVVRGVGGGGSTRTSTACCAVQHSEAHSTKQCDVGPCSRCATSTSWKEACVHGSVRGSSVSLLGACDACQWAIGSPPHTSGRGAALRVCLLPESSEVCWSLLLLWQLESRWRWGS